MTKRVYRFFFDFIDGQQKWLNDMAADGWRLVKCGQLAYHFEHCKPNEYEYAVEFVAGKSYSGSKDYKSFLESIGYKTFYKNINVGVYVGKVKFRPWATSGGQLATAPGGIQKELIIAEKKRDGKPFELHTDLSGLMTQYKTIRNAYLWASFCMLAAATVALASTAWLLINSLLVGAIACGLGVIILATVGTLCLKPAIKFVHRVRQLREKAKTNEYESPPLKRSIIISLVIVIMSVTFGIGMFWLISSSGGTINSGSALMLSSRSGNDHWSANYKKYNGNRRRTITLEEGSHTFTVTVTSTSGEVDFSLKGKDGTTYYESANIPTSSFSVQLELAAKEKVTMRIDARNHSGAYRVNWN